MNKDIEASDQLLHYLDQLMHGSLIKHVRIPSDNSWVSWLFTQYIEKLDLEQLKSMELDPPYERKASSIFTLTLHTEEVQLKVCCTETKKLTCFSPR